MTPQKTRGYSLLVRILYAFFFQTPDEEKRKRHDNSCKVHEAESTYPPKEKKKKRREKKEKEDVVAMKRTGQSMTMEIKKPISHHHFCLILPSHPLSVWSR